MVPIPASITLYSSYLITILHQQDSTTVSLVPFRCDGSQYRNGCWRMTSTMSDEAASRHVLLAVWRGDDNRFADKLLYTCIIDGDKSAGSKRKGPLEVLRLPRLDTPYRWADVFPTLHQVAPVGLHLYGRWDH